MDLEKLEKLAELKNKGVLTEKEFETEKSKLLGTNQDKPVYKESKQEQTKIKPGTANFALREFWVNYTGWGRACLSEFWWAYLFYSFIPLCVFLFFVAAFSLVFDARIVSSVFGFSWMVFGIATIVPWFCLIVRRLHDSNKSAWNLFWLFLPIAGPIILFIFLCQPSDLKSNCFGVPRIK